jgi:multicomponent Na+:H+ antiporter subunit E
MRRIQIAIPIFLAYLALSGSLTPANLIVGALVALGVSALLPAGNEPIFAWKRSPIFMWALFRYLFVVGADIVKGGIVTAQLVLDPKLPVNPGIIAIPSGSNTELGAALSAHAISLSPGELVVEMDDEGTLYVHCLDVAKSSQYADEAQSLRRTLLNEMFE